MRPLCLAPCAVVWPLRYVCSRWGRYSLFGFFGPIYLIIYIGRWLLSDAQYFARCDGVAGLHLVQLVQALQSDAVELADVVHALVRLHDVDGVVLEVLRCTLALLLQIYEVACCGCIVLGQVVEVVQILQAHPRLLAYSGHVVTRLHHDEVVLVVAVHHVVEVEGVVIHYTLLLCEQCIFARVELAQTIHLDDAYERFGIGGAGGISCRFQSACPSPVVCDAQTVESLVASALQEDAVVDEALPCTAVFAELLIGRIIVAQYVRAGPRTAALDAEVVVGLGGQSASSGIALQQSLCQSDACRYAVVLHLLDGPVLIFVDICPVCLIGSLRHQRQAAAHNKEQSQEVSCLIQHGFPFEGTKLPKNNWIMKEKHKIMSDKALVGVVNREWRHVSHLNVKVG